MKIVAGVDVGGTHITSGLFDLETNSLISTSIVRKHIDTSGDKPAVVNAWASAIRESFETGGYPVSAVGIAMPGPFDYENGISYIKGQHKYEKLYGENIKLALAEALNIDPSQIRFVNDASAFLLGEIWAGGAQGFSNVIGITLGTGLGSAVFRNDLLEEGDLYSTAYRQGVTEDYVSARWLIGEYKHRTGEVVKGVKEIADRCSNDEEARAVFRAFGEQLFEVLETRYASELPEAVVIGGNISKAWDHFIPYLKERMRARQFSFEVCKAQLGEEAALTGAACLWKN